jgi:RHS repeat-associated protein
VGNRTALISSAGTTNYTYNPADELLTAGAATFTYDGNGNQLTKMAGSATATYGWDALNRLVAVSGGAVNTQYQYDGDGNRVTQQVPAGTYKYSNDAASALPVVLNENGPDGTIDYLYGSTLASAMAANFQYYYQFDGIGSAINITDQAGAQKANYAYDPWGKLTLPMDPLGTKEKYKFTGEALDPNDGLLFLRARHYDLSIGRFISRDLIRGSRFTPNHSNAYAYAASNPTRFNDRAGLMAVEWRAAAGPNQLILLPSDVSSMSMSTPIIIGDQAPVPMDPAIGPAFQAELRGIIVDKLLFGDVGTFLRDLGLSAYDTLSPSVSMKRSEEHTSELQSLRYHI